MINDSETSREFLLSEASNVSFQFDTNNDKPKFWHRCLLHLQNRQNPHKNQNRNREINNKEKLRIWDIWSNIKQTNKHKVSPISWWPTNFLKEIMYKECFLHKHREIQQKIVWQKEKTKYRCTIKKINILNLNPSAY